MIRASRASKVAGTFLVLFWCAKENLTSRNRALPPRTGVRTISGSLLARKREQLALMEEHSPLVKTPQKGYHKEKSKGDLLMRAYERRLKYAQVYSPSDPVSGTHPSAAREVDLANLRAEEMK